MYGRALGGQKDAVSARAKRPSWVSLGKTSIPLLVLCPAREDHRPTTIRHHLALQKTLDTSVEYGPRRDRVFQDPGQPDCRARWSDRALGFTGSQDPHSQWISSCSAKAWRSRATEKPGALAASMITFSRRASSAAAAGRSLIAPAGMTTAPCWSEWITSLGDTIIPATLTVPPKSTR